MEARRQREQFVQETTQYVSRAQKAQMVAQQEYTVDNKRRQRRMEQLAGESEMQRQIEEVH